MTDTRIASICDEYGIAIVPPNVQPGVGETRAVGAITNIDKRRGEGHLRLVLTTLAETTNNKAFIDRDTLWCVSHLIRAYPHIVENDMSRWLECFDLMQFGEMAKLNSKTLKGHVNSPSSLAGMVNERIYRFFGRAVIEPDMFDYWRQG